MIIKTRKRSEVGIMSYIQVTLTDKQAKVLHELSVQQDLSQEKVMVQALKVYQLYLTGNLIRVRKTKL